MKNTFFLLAIGTLLSFTTQAQKKKATVKLNVPETINTSFQTKYTSSEDAKWSKNSKGNYVVSFIDADKHKQSAEFDEAGAVVRSKTVYNEEGFPETIVNSVASKYTDAKITEATRLEIAGISPYYKVKIQQADNKKELLISEAGTIAE
jgi:hypothetical protein